MEKKEAGSAVAEYFAKQVMKDSIDYVAVITKFPQYKDDINNYLRDAGVLELYAGADS